MLKSDKEKTLERICGKPWRRHLWNMCPLTH